MSHYEITYTVHSKEDEVAMDKKALLDCEAYLGDRWKKVFVKEFLSFGGKDLTIPYSSAKQWLKSIDFACMICGIQGYPTRAIKRAFLAQFRKESALPPVTPLEAQTRLQTEESFEIDGFKFTLDGPQGSPRTSWFPSVVKGAMAWVPAGEEGTEITAETLWYSWRL